ncbi:MAG: DNA topoisomerase IB, partial [Actinomycetota bacterium]|nr:DNA topoisomerase IB [Actinomycetota bacterium]
VRGDSVSFDFVAKGGKRRLQSVVDPAVAAVLGSLKARRGGGPELLAYRHPASRGAWVDIRSDDINDYIRERSGIDCSAKDFRTWNATVLAAVALAASSGAASPRAKVAGVTRAMSEVAYYLGNTPAVVRSSYVDPRVVDRYMAGDTISEVLPSIGADTVPGHPATQGAIEFAVIDLLDPMESTLAEPAA